MDVKITGGGRKLTGTLRVPGDKSISHRSVMLGAIASGVTKVDGFLTGEDCRSTIRCFRALGVDIEMDGTNLTVRGGRFSAPSEILDVGNSGTTLRLMTGLLVGQPFQTEITGDSSIQKRPMKRVTDPLSLMGAEISGERAPVTIRGKKLQGIRYTLPVASAQVKSAILLASLYAEGETIIEEPIATRDHTEIMLRYLGADITREGNFIMSRGLQKPLDAKGISVPGDISSAAFLIVAALLLPGSDVRLEGVGVNPTRTGIIHVLRRMGADIRLENEREVCGEAVADILVRHSKLRGTTVGGAEIPTLIDEIPALAVAALFAEGETTVCDAEELRVKETDRIQVVAEEFQKFSAEITPQADGMLIRGCAEKLHGAKADSRGDHRLAMSLSVLATAVRGESIIGGADCADISFPGFYKVLL